MMSGRRFAQLLLIGVGLGVLAWLLGLLVDQRNPLWLVLTGVAYAVGLAAVYQPWLRRQETNALNEAERAAAAELRNRLELVIDGNNDGIWDCDFSSGEEGDVFWSDTAHRLLHLDPGKLGNSFDVLRKMMRPEDKDAFDKALRRHLVYDAPFKVEVGIVVGASGNYAGELRYFRICGKAKRGENGGLQRMAGSIADITDRKTKEEELLHNAYHDRLTGLRNRTWLIEAIGKLEGLSQTRADYIYAVLLVNIDHFKQVNDNIGIAQGDDVLRQSAERLRSVVGSDDDLARLGSDEFAVLIRGLRQSGDATRVAESIREAFSAPFALENRDVYLTVSMGLVFSDEQRERPESILQDANSALSQAKAQGGGRLATFKRTMRDRERLRYMMMRDLRTALDENRFYVCYQPQIDVRTKTLAGFEALLRWHHPDRGDILPTQFVPVLEETGEILRVGEWVLRKSCEQARTWVDAGQENLVMSVNVSAPQFNHGNVVEMVERALRDSGLEARHLKIELTESVAMNEVERVIATLERLRALGVAVAIDDFGTGYSLLSYLKRYPITELKIDKSFVSDLPSSDSKAIVDMIVSMARSLSLEIVAEGVETEQQLSYLESNGVDIIQGFYYGIPMRPADVEANVFPKWKPSGPR